jgi:hypothetical protein
LGNPTGLEFGTDSRGPEVSKFRKLFFVMASWLLFQPIKVFFLTFYFEITED